MMNQETQERKKYAVERTPRISKRMPSRPRSRSVITETIISETTADGLNERQAVLADLLAQARALVPDPLDSPTRRACRESPLDEGIVKKFRGQGFNL